MFESDLQPYNTSPDQNSSHTLNSTSLRGLHHSSEAYGLQTDINHYAPLGNSDPLMGSSLTVGGNTLIQGGPTSITEINEVNGLLSQSIYNRNQRTTNRTYTNYHYSTNDSRARWSANETVGMDRGDSLTNPIHVGNIVYRSSATVNGYIGYTNNGRRDQDDYFSFNVGKSGDIKISLDGLWQNAGLALYNSNKKLIKWSDKSGNKSELITENLGVGRYFARVYSLGQQPWSHGATSYSLKIERQADQLESYWKNLLVDRSVENAALNSIKYENGLSRTDVIGILKSAGDGSGVTSTELKDLRNFYNKAINTSKIQASLKVLSKKVLFSETSNQWYTGSDSIRANLGNLAANSSTNHLNLLIGKHLLGTDRPAIHRNGSNNLVGRYTRANGRLFINGAAATDVRQGATGDCYFLAGLGGVAHEKSSAISEMFQDNGDGTWSVRFYTNGKVDYVTVDRMMPTNGHRRYIYANSGQSVSGNNELWVALAEKAYAQVNESGRIGQDGTNFYGDGNPDNGIGWGLESAAIKHIANISTTSEKLTNRSFLGWSWSGMDRGELIKAVNSNRVVTMGYFKNNAADSDETDPTNINSAVEGHSYVVTGYTVSTGRFELRNPWGFRHLSLTFNQLLQLGGRVTYSKH